MRENKSSRSPRASASFALLLAAVAVVSSIALSPVTEARAPSDSYPDPEAGYWEVSAVPGCPPETICVDWYDFYLNTRLGSCCIDELDLGLGIEACPEGLRPFG